MPTASNNIYRELRARILRWELRPGAAISERALSTEMGGSRTPVREALLRLRHEGFVEIKPPGSYVVRQWSVADIRARLDLRVAIEGVAIAWAAERMTPAVCSHLAAICNEEEEAIRNGDLEQVPEMDIRFHETLIAASGNREIMRAARQNRLMDTIFPIPAAMPVERCRLSLEEHQKIVEMVSDRNADEARGMLAEHLKIPGELFARLEEEEAARELQEVAGI